MPVCARLSYKYNLEVFILLDGLIQLILRVGLYPSGL